MGTNDLNQRLIGEIHLDDFEVTHTKDAILWSGDEEDQVLDELKKKCSDYREEARKSTNSGPPTDSRGPNEKTISLAVEDLKAEITSSEMIDALRLDVVPPEKVVQQIKAKILEAWTGFSY